MRLCNLNISRILNKWGYDGNFENIHEEIYKIGYGGETEVNEKTKIPRLDDVAYWLLKRHSIMIVIEPFIYNGVIYSYETTIYSPILFDNEPEHMNGIKVYNEDGYSFLEYEDALEAGVLKSIEIVENTVKEVNSHESWLRKDGETVSFDKGWMVNIPTYGWWGPFITKDDALNFSSTCEDFSTLPKDVWYFHEQRKNFK